MNPEDKKIAMSAFVNSLCGETILADAAGAVQLSDASNLESALEVAFDAVEKHKHERGIMAAEKRDNSVIFDP